MEIITGAVVAVLVQLIKKWFKGNTLATLGSVLVLSLVGAFVYQYFVETGYWTTMVQTLAYAGAIHNFVIRQFES